MPQAALALAVWVGSSAAFAASAIGAGTALAAGVGFATIGATLAAEVYAVNAATAALTPKIKDPGRTLQWQADPRAGILYPMGRCAVAGKIIFNQSAPSTSRKYLNFVTVYSGVPAEEFEAFQANGVTVPFTADSGEGASGYYLNRMWLKSQLGHEAGSWLHWTATGTKDTPANHGGMPTEWTSEHLTTGYAATLWGMEYDTARFSSGVPTPRMIGSWAKTYDPRQDDTYPGGDGDHRWDDEDTWTWSPCPYRNALTWAIGRRNGGQLVLGLGYDLEEIDVASFVHGMNVSDTNEWTMGGLVDSDDNPWEVLKAILQPGAGYPILGGTQLSVMVNAPAVSVATITEADVVGAITVPAQVSVDDRINTVWPSYTEEALDWQVVTPDAPVQVSEYVTVDGEERSIPLGMPLAQDATQVGQLCRYAIEDARELSGIVLACKPWTQWIAPGLCVTANVPSAGLNGQKLRVQKRKRDPASMVVTFISRTETEGKHAYALGQTNSPPDTPALTGGDPLPVAAPVAIDWTAVGATFTDNGQSIPAVVITGSVFDPHVARLVAQYRPDGATDWANAGDIEIPDDSDVRLEITAVTRGTTYNVRIAFQSVRGALTTWTDLDDATAGDFSLDEIVAAFDDGALTPGEKLYVVPQLKALIAARTALRAQADALNLVYGYASGRTEYEDAADALDAALADLDTPVDWDDSSDLTEVPDPAAFRAAFENAIAKEVGLQTSISYINSIKTSDSKNLWRGVDWAVSGGGVLITPAFGQSGRGARLPAATAGARLYGLKSGFDGRYMLSFLAKSTGGAATLRGKMRDASNAVLSDLADTSWSVTTAPQVFSWLLTSTDPDFVTAELSLFEDTGDVASGRTIEITDWKLTPGDTVTAWSPSPDDPDLLRLATYTGALNATYGATFGIDIAETFGGSPATLANFKTILGIAASITGQASAATDATIQTGATKNLLYYQSGSPSSPANGALWADTSTTPVVWKIRVSGSWEEAANYGGKFGDSLYEAAGVLATNANYKTSSGTAAAISGQSAWATYSTLSPTTIAGRGQYFGSDGKTYDYRVMPYNYSVDGVAGRYTQPLSASVGSITVSSFSLYLPANSGVTTISIPSTSFSGLSNDTTYTIFYRPDYGDWFPVVSSNAAPYKTSRDGYIEIGTIATPSSGGVWVAPTSDYTSTGLFNVYDCIDADALLACGKRAGSAIEGDHLTMMAPGGDIAVPGRVNAMRMAHADCLTLRTENGGKITVSRSAPIMTRDGQGFLPYAIRADDCEPGMAIPTLCEGRVIWTLLDSIAPAGRRAVAMISANNGVYAAADADSAVMVFTHNMYNKA